MQILDFYPRQGWFAPGEPVRLGLHLDADAAGWIDARLTITHLDRIVDEIDASQWVQPGLNQIEINWQPPNTDRAGYGAAIQTRVKGGEQTSQTAFDILPDWTVFPRYGFLCDFSNGRNDAAATLEQLLPYHINGLQFYDWQYRHDRLVAPTEEYLDPLGRALSLKTVRALIDAAHARKMAAMPYLAIYAASAAFWRAHPDWALYDGQKQPIPFGEDFLGLMDPSAGRPWAAHLLDACAAALAALPFDGLHIDQYGEPHQAWDSAGKPVDLPNAFAGFIKAAKARFGNKPVLFNAVGNWPIESLARAPLDFVYIEVWPPKVTYTDLVEIVQNAKRLSGQKPVVIALYLPASQPANIQLTDALLLACGASRIELGEGARLLADPYYPLHQPLDPVLKQAMRQLADFNVRYGEWLGPLAPGLADRGAEMQGEVWCFHRQGDGRKVIGMVNMNGLGPTPRWDQAHSMPTRLERPLFRFQMDKPAQRVLWFCPEQPQQPTLPLDFRYQDGWVEFSLPSINLLAGITIDE